MEALSQALAPYGMIAAGALFGAGWAAWADVVLHSAVVSHSAVQAVHHLPGVVATVAVLLMALMGRGDGDGFIGYSTDDGEECRAKCGLFLAYCCSFGAIAGAVVMLLVIKQQGGDMAIGVGAVCQTAILSLSGLIAWLCKAGDGGDGYSLLG